MQFTVWHEQSHAFIVSLWSNSLHSLHIYIIAGKVVFSEWFICRVSSVVWPRSRNQRCLSIHISGRFIVLPNVWCWLPQVDFIARSIVSIRRVVYWRFVRCPPGSGEWFPLVMWSWWEIRWSVSVCFMCCHSIVIVCILWYLFKLFIPESSCFKIFHISNISSM